MPIQPEAGDEDGPMIYVERKDYAASAQKYRKELLEQGEEVVLQSELPSLIPCKEGESAGDYAKRYSDGMNEMIRRGVYILNDETTHDVVPNVFVVDGREFDVSERSGITKREYREFSDLTAGGGIKYADIPEKFLRFERRPGDPEPGYSFDDEETRAEL